MNAEQILVDLADDEVMEIVHSLFGAGGMFDDSGITVADGDRIDEVQGDGQDTIATWWSSAREAEAVIRFDTEAEVRLVATSMDRFVQSLVTRNTLGGYGDLEEEELEELLEELDEIDDLAGLHAHMAGWRKRIEEVTGPWSQSAEELREADDAWKSAFETSFSSNDGAA